MGSKGVGSKGVTRPASPTTTGVCCMCGDHGLAQELFKCRVCLLRSQHKYCSNLYPKADSYRACNWCLSQEGASDVVPAKDQATTTGINNNTGKLTRGAYPQHLINKAVKKQKVQDGGPPPPGKIKIGRRAMRSEQGKKVFRGKVRRYKLLEEVSS